MDNNVKMIEFQEKGDERGHLVIVEGMKDIPFDIKRIFYIYGSDSDAIRGQHANSRSEFVLINVAGTSKVEVKDGKGNEAIFSLNWYGKTCMISAKIRYCFVWHQNIMIHQNT